MNITTLGIDLIAYSDQNRPLNLIKMIFNKMWDFCKNTLEAYYHYYLVRLFFKAFCII